MNLQNKLTDLKRQALSEIEQTETPDKINEIRVHLLGKKGPITEILRGMRELPKEQRPEVGSFANKVRDELTNAIDEQKEKIETLLTAKRLENEAIDVTLPGVPVKTGTPHIIMPVSYTHLTLPTKA